MNPDTGLTLQPLRSILTWGQLGGIMKTGTIAALALSALALAGCQTTVEPPPQTTPYALNEKEIEIVKSGVRDSLKDPASALFRGQFKAARGSKGTIYVCGLVNARNSFGGYVGDKPFIGILATAPGGKGASFTVADMGGTDTDTFVTAGMCKTYGVI